MSPHPRGRVEDDLPATVVVGRLQTSQVVSVGRVGLPAHCTHLDNITADVNTTGCPKKTGISVQGLFLGP